MDFNYDCVYFSCFSFNDGCPVKLFGTTFFIVLSILGYGLGSFFYKIANNHLSSMMVVLIVAITGIVLVPIPFLFLKVDTTINTIGVLFAVLGGITMGLGSVGFSYALKTGNVGEVTVLSGLYPILTLILSFLFLDEGITIKKVLGIVFAICSFIMISI